jgi:hypothetical protein
MPFIKWGRIMRILTSQRLDQFAVATSGICAAHCLLTPLVVVLTPALAVFGLSDDAFHRLLLLFVLPTSLIGLVLGCGHHRDAVVILLGAVGVSTLALAAVAGHAVLGEVGEQLATVAGGLVAASAHVRNFRLCRRHTCHGEDPDRGA